MHVYALQAQTEETYAKILNKDPAAPPQWVYRTNHPCGKHNPLLLLRLLRNKQHHGTTTSAFLLLLLILNRRHPIAKVPDAK